MQKPLRYYSAFCAWKEFCAHYTGRRKEAPSHHPLMWVKSLHAGKVSHRQDFNTQCPNADEKIILPTAMDHLSGPEGSIRFGRSKGPVALTWKHHNPCENFGFFKGTVHGQCQLYTSGWGHIGLVQDQERHSTGLCDDAKPIPASS